jgi:hypothetical protein
VIPDAIAVVVHPGPSRSSASSLFLFPSPPSLAHRGNFFLSPCAPPRPAALSLFPDINYVPVGRTLRRADPPVCVSHLREGGGPGARLVIPRRGRRNPCVRSLRSYKVQFKKILSLSLSLSLFATRSRYTPRFCPTRFLVPGDKSRNSRYPLTQLALAGLSRSSVDRTLSAVYATHN